MKQETTHKDRIIAELELCYDKNFEVPAGLYIPIGNRVLVKECAQEEHKTIGGIILSGSGNLQHAKIGIVYRIGDGVTLPLKIGMKVAYDKTANNGVIHKGVGYTDLMDFQVFSVVPPENYMMVHVPDTEERRREERIDATSRIYKQGEAKIEEINHS